MHKFFSGTFFNFETVRILGMATSGGADLAEVLEAVGNIRDNDGESWHLAWLEQRQKAERLAKEASETGDHVSARKAYLRASNYARASYYMLAGDGPMSPDHRVLPLIDQAVSLFREGIKHIDENESSVVVLEIPYEGIMLPGYLFLPAPWRRLPDRRTPVVVSNVGADGLCEELYYFMASTAVEMGYAALVYEGPGQGATLHRQGLRFRPDYEVVAGAVMDYLETLSRSRPDLGLDLDSVAVLGATLGGYLALRSAAGDDRFRACVAIDPVHDLWDFATAQMPRPVLAAWERGWIGDAAIDAVMGLAMRLNFQMKWNMHLTGTILGLLRPSHIIKAMKAYTLRLPDDGSLLARVRCPVLVTGAKKSMYLDVSTHSQAVYDALTGLKEGRQKQLWVSETPGDGGLQAKVGAITLLNQRVFRFLDQHFGIKRTGSSCI